MRVVAYGRYLVSFGHVLGRPSNVPSRKFDLIQDYGVKSGKRKNYNAWVEFMKKDILIRWEGMMEKNTW